MLAMTLVGNELSKEQSTADSGLMTVKGTDLPVQVASSDMAIADDESGALLTRDGDGAVGVRAMTSAIGLSSDMPVEFFHDLKALLIDVDHDDNEATPTFSVNFDVNGAGRVPVPWASTGSGAFPATLLLPCVYAAAVAKTLPFLVFPLPSSPSRETRCLLLVCFFWLGT